MPTRAAMTPNLVPAELLPSAAALNQVMWNSAMIVGPALGGDRREPPRARRGRTASMSRRTWSRSGSRSCCTRSSRTGMTARRWSAAGRRVKEGLRYLRGKRILQSTFTVDIVAMVFGMPRALFPVLAASSSVGGPEAVGWLFSAVAVGALVGALASGGCRRIRRQGSRSCSRSRCGASASSRSGSRAIGW